MKSVVSVYPRPVQAPHPPVAARPQPHPGLAVSATWPWPRYTTTKFLALDAYCATASQWRVAAVLVLTPMPAFLGSLLPSFVPLENPMAGFAANYAVILHGFLFVFLASIGTITLTLGGASIPRAQYSEWKVLQVAFVLTMPVSAVTAVMCLVWRFPVPFLILLSSPVWIGMMVVTHYLLLRQTFKRFPTMLASFKRYKVALIVQSSQLGLYTGLTILFDRISTLQQVVVVALFPGLKYFLKALLRRHTTAFEETGAEITISTIEICASLYQAMIMQTSPSAVTMGAIMGLDLVHAIIAIKLFMGENMTTPHREVVPRALALLEAGRKEGADPRDLVTFSSKLTKEEVVVVTEALELVSAADRILLVEYFEVSVPIVNALFLLATFQSTSTLYNTRLNRFYHNTALVMDATTSVLIYSLLQGLSLVIFQRVLRRRHNMSAFYHLAFVLEYHWRSIQGKLLVFFTIIFYFTLIHYGTDFSLRFDFAKLVQEMPVRAP